MDHLGDSIDLGQARLAGAGPETLAARPAEGAVRGWVGGAGWSQVISLTCLAISRLLVMGKQVTGPRVTYPAGQHRLGLTMAKQDFKAERAEVHRPLEWATVSLLPHFLAKASQRPAQEQEKTPFLKKELQMHMAKGVGSGRAAGLGLVLQSVLCLHP